MRVKDNRGMSQSLKPNPDPDSSPEAERQQFDAARGRYSEQYIISSVFQSKTQSVLQFILKIMKTNKASVKTKQKDIKTIQKSWTFDASRLLLIEFGGNGPAKPAGY